MRNITISLPDELYTKARVLAAERDKSVSALFRDFLLEIGQKEPEFERLRRMQNELLNSLEASRQEGPHFNAADRLSRDAVHDRDALR